MSSRNSGPWVVLEFAAATGVTPVADCFCPGTLTNQIEAASWEPRLLDIIDPRADHHCSLKQTLL